MMSNRKNHLNLKDLRSIAGEELGKRVRNSRIRAGLTQTQVSELTGISYIGGIEAGSSSINEVKLRELANELNVNPLFLIMGASYVGNSRVKS